MNRTSTGLLNRASINSFLPTPFFFWAKKGIERLNTIGFYDWLKTWYRKQKQVLRIPCARQTKQDRERYNCVWPLSDRGIADEKNLLVKVGKEVGDSLVEHPFPTIDPRCLTWHALCHTLPNQHGRNKKTRSTSSLKTPIIYSSKLYH